MRHASESRSSNLQTFSHFHTLVEEVLPLFGQSRKPLASGFGANDDEMPRLPREGAGSAEEARMPDLWTRVEVEARLALT